MTTTPPDVNLLGGLHERREDAFAELVRRHAGWVCGVAQRRLRDSHLAEDAVQATFALLFRKAPSFAAEQAVVAWLHRTVCYATLSLQRTERRCQRCEHEAHLMREQQRDPDAGAEWTHLAPILDELIEKLSAGDREAILLRFYRQMSHEQVAAALGVNEEAARKRVTRAVERLRKLADASGTPVTTSALAAMLVGHVARPAPAGLAAASINVGLAGKSGAAAAGPWVTSIIHGVNSTLFWLNVKVAMIVLMLVTVFAFAGVKFVLHQRGPSTTATALTPGRASIGRLSNGAVFELIGVRRRSDEAPAQQWWNAEGSAAIAAPYDKVDDLAAVGAGLIASQPTTNDSAPRTRLVRYELAYRRNLPPNFSWAHLCPQAVANGQFGLATRDGEGPPMGMPTFAAFLTVPEDQAVVTIRGEVATGDWSALCSFTVDANQQITMSQPAPPDVAASASLAKDGTLFISVGYRNPTGNEAIQIDQRLIARSDDGRQQRMYAGRAARNGMNCLGVRSIDRSLTPHGDQRVTIQFQVREYNHWIEFRNVSLKPDGKSDVQIVTSDDRLTPPAR